MSDIGNRTRAAEIAQSAQATMLADIERQRESISGVNLDEEAAALVRYQQAYQAAGKTIAVAQAMFDTVLDILR
ncbi:MAG: hypothetical protein M5U08_04420 [Burkholderiales bacterium]|nr:hypothetical protein [Burkholderiales bacterium]